MDKKITPKRFIVSLMLIFIFLLVLSVVRADVWVSQDSGTEHTLNDAYFLNSQVGWVVGGDWPGPATDIMREYCVV